MSHPAWNPTPTWWRALSIAAIGACAAVLTRRSDMVVIISGFVLASALEWRPPRERPSLVRTHVPEPPRREGEPLTVRHLVDDPPNAFLTLVNETNDGTHVTITWSTPLPSYQGRCPIWGVQHVGPVAGHWLTQWGGWAAPAVFEPVHPILVLPVPLPTRLPPLPPPVGSSPGIDPGDMSGDGLDYTGLRILGEDETPFRVNWPASLRTGQIIVTATLLDTAGTYLVLLDGGGSGNTHHEVVREIAGLFTALMRLGNHVALGILGCGALTPVPAGSGPRHIARLERALAQALPQPNHPANDHQPARISRLTLPRGTVVIAYTPLAATSATPLLTRLRRSGHRIAVIDTTGPNNAPLDQLTRRTQHLRLTVTGIPVIERDDGPRAAPRALTSLRHQRP